jgi:hypothetical protein
MKRQHHPGARKGNLTANRNQMKSNRQKQNEPNEQKQSHEKEPEQNKENRTEGQTKKSKQKTTHLPLLFHQ